MSARCSCLFHRGLGDWLFAVLAALLVLWAFREPLLRVEPSPCPVFGQAIEGSDFCGGTR